MATNVRTSPETIASQFAVSIRDIPGVQQLWLSINADVLELWVITDPIEGEEERDIYAAATELSQQYPDAYLRPIVLNPNFFDDDTDLNTVVRSGARQIELRRP